MASQCAPPRSVEPVSTVYSPFCRHRIFLGSAHSTHAGRPFLPPSVPFLTPNLRPIHVPRHHPRSPARCSRFLVPRFLCHWTVWVGSIHFLPFEPRCSYFLLSILSLVMLRFSARYVGPNYHAWLAHSEDSDHSATASGASERCPSLRT